MQTMAGFRAAAPAPAAICKHQHTCRLVALLPVTTQIIPSSIYRGYIDAGESYLQACDEELKEQSDKVRGEEEKRERARLERVCASIGPGSHRLAGWTCTTEFY